MDKELRRMKIEATNAVGGGLICLSKRLLTNLWSLRNCLISLFICWLTKRDRTLCIYIHLVSPTVDETNIPFVLSSPAGSTRYAFLHRPPGAGPPGVVV